MARGRGLRSALPLLLALSISLRRKLPEAISLHPSEIEEFERLLGSVASSSLGSPLGRRLGSPVGSPLASPVVDCWAGNPVSLWSRQVLYVASFLGGPMPRATVTHCVSC